jgi:hypothetical protein
MHTLQPACAWITTGAIKLPVNCCCKPLSCCDSCHRALAAWQPPLRVLNLCHMLPQCPPGIRRGNRGLQRLVHLQQQTQATVVQPNRAQTPCRPRRAAETDLCCSVETRKQLCSNVCCGSARPGIPRSCPGWRINQNGAPAASASQTRQRYIDRYNTRPCMPGPAIWRCSHLWLTELSDRDTLTETSRVREIGLGLQAGNGRG